MSHVIVPGGDQRQCQEFVNIFSQERSSTFEGFWPRCIWCTRWMRTGIGCILSRCVFFAKLFYKSKADLKPEENYRWRQIYKVSTSWYVQGICPFIQHVSTPALFMRWRPHFLCDTARFSPDDKFSRHRVTIKKRHGVLLTQLPAKPMWWTSQT